MQSSALENSHACRSLQGRLYGGLPCIARPPHDTHVTQFRIAVHCSSLQLRRIRVRLLAISSAVVRQEGRSMGDGAGRVAGAAKRKRHPLAKAGAGAGRGPLVPHCPPAQPGDRQGRQLRQDWQAVQRAVEPPPEARHLQGRLEPGGGAGPGEGSPSVGQQMV
ncbi:hypothetical protein HaLaN_17131, partial [Haematococcus lacustris]